MTAILPEWPKTDPITAGAPWEFTFSVADSIDVTGWTWRSTVRSWPDGPVVARWTIRQDPDDTHKWYMTLTGAETRPISAGMSFDLWQVTPVVVPYLLVESLNVVDPYSYEEEEPDA